MKKKLIFLFILIFGLLVFFVFFGQSNLSKDDFLKIKNSYSSEFFPTNSLVLNDYIQDLSSKRSFFSLDSIQLVDAELNSAKVFYFYLISIQTYQDSSMSCNEKRNLIKNYYNSSLNHKNSFNSSYSKIIFQDQKNLLSVAEPNVVLEYSNQINLILNSVCQ
jgi:hypothetical protein